jgi:hypothetical protein
MGCIVVTMLIGFTWGGWVTGGTAAEMAETAASGARAELAAKICVNRFVNGADAVGQLASLKKSDSWQRDDFIEKGGWATLPGMKEPVAGAADICAQKLMEAKLPSAEPAATSG